MNQLGYDERVYNKIYTELWDKWDRFAADRGYKDTLRLVVARCALIETKLAELNKLIISLDSTPPPADNDEGSTE